MSTTARTLLFTKHTSFPALRNSTLIRTPKPLHPNIKFPKPNLILKSLTPASPNLPIGSKYSLLSCLTQTLSFHHDYWPNSIYLLIGYLDPQPSNPCISIPKDLPLRGSLLSAWTLISVLHPFTHAVPRNSAIPSYPGDAPMALHTSSPARRCTRCHLQAFLVQRSIASHDWLEGLGLCSRVGRRTSCTAPGT